MSEIAVLTAAESDVLADCEDTISRGLMTFVEVGQALITIRDNRLYRATHATFDEYCERRWELSRQYAYRLIDAVHVRESILSPQGDKIDDADPLSPPATERHARPLAKMLPHPMAEPEVRAEAEREIREAWAEAVATAPRDRDGQPKVTAKHVEQTLAARDARAEAERPADHPSGGEAHAGLRVGLGSDAQAEGVAAPDAGVGEPVGPGSPETSAEERITSTHQREAVDPLDDPEEIERQHRARSSVDVANALVMLLLRLDPDPIRWLESTWVPDAYRNRDLPRVRDAFTVSGLRTIAKHIETLAGHIDRDGEGEL